MEYEKYFDLLAEMEFRVFSPVPYQRGHAIGSFLGRLFRKILSYLNKDAVGKEALRAGINMIEDIENRPLKKAVKSRLAESRSNLIRKAKEKNSLIRGSRYKIFAEIRGASVSTRWSK